MIPDLACRGRLRPRPSPFSAELTSSGRTTSPRRFRPCGSPRPSVVPARLPAADMWSALRTFRITDAIDILLVAAVLYRIFVMFKETRAVQMLLGLGGLMVASFLARRFELFSASWLLDNFWSFWVLALIVLFQPELRRALAQAGHNPFFGVVTRADRLQQSRTLGEVAKAA